MRIASPLLPSCRSCSSPPPRSPRTSPATARPGVAGPPRSAPSTRSRTRSSSGPRPRCPAALGGTTVAASSSASRPTSPRLTATRTSRSPRRGRSRHTTSKNNGSFAFTLRPARTTQYRVVAQASPPVTSGGRLVSVRPLVGLVIADTTPRAGARVRFRGTVRPEHDGATALIQRRSSTGRFVTVARATLRDAGTDVLQLLPARPDPPGRQLPREGPRRRRPRQRLQPRRERRRPLRAPPSRQHHVPPEEGAGCVGVDALGHVRRLAERVAGDRRAGDDVRLRRAGAEEVRAARVAVAGAALARGRVLRQPEVALAQGAEGRGRVLAAVLVAR